MNPDQPIIDRLRAEGKSEHFIEGYLRGWHQVGDHIYGTNEKTRH